MLEAPTSENANNRKVSVISAEQHNALTFTGDHVDLVTQLLQRKDGRDGDSTCDVNKHALPRLSVLEDLLGIKHDGHVVSLPSFPSLHALRSSIPWRKDGHHAPKHDPYFSSQS
jgi:hypothetical protein